MSVCNVDGLAIYDNSIDWPLDAAFQADWTLLKDCDNISIHNNLLGAGWLSKDPVK